MAILEEGPKDSLHRVSNFLWLASIQQNIKAVIEFNQNNFFSGSKWRTKQLTYKITKYSNKLGREETDKAIEDAFKLWSKYTDLTFEKSDRGKIDIRFEERNHGDNSAFDGPGGTLAHAYFPVSQNFHENSDKISSTEI